MPDNSVTSATLSGDSTTFTKPDASTFTLDPSHLQKDGRLVGVAYDHAENVLSLTTEGAIDVDLDYSVPRPPPTPIPSSDATLSWVTIGCTAPDQ